MGTPVRVKLIHLCQDLLVFLSRLVALGIIAELFGLNGQLPGDELEETTRGLFVRLQWPSRIPQQTQLHGKSQSVMFPPPVVDQIQIVLGEQPEANLLALPQGVMAV